MSNVLSRTLVSYEILKNTLWGGGKSSLKSREFGLNVVNQVSLVRY